MRAVPVEEVTKQSAYLLFYTRTGAPAAAAGAAGNGAGPRSVSGSGGLPRASSLSEEIGLCAARPPAPTRAVSNTQRPCPWEDDDGGGVDARGLVAPVG